MVKMQIQAAALEIQNQYTLAGGEVAHGNLPVRQTPHGIWSRKSSGHALRSTALDVGPLGQFQATGAPLSPCAPARHSTGVCQRLVNDTFVGEFSQSKKCGECRADPRPPLASTPLICTSRPGPRGPPLPFQGRCLSQLST